MKIISVDHDNSDYFSEVAPGYIRAMLAMPWVGALGAVLEEKASAYAVGFLLYEEGEDGEFFVRWMYVLDRFRYRGVGENLLAEFCLLAKKKGCEGVSVVFSETSGDKEYLKRFESYFTEKGFSNEWKLPPSYVIGAENYANLPFIALAEKAALSEVKALGEIDAASFNAFMGLKGLKGYRASDFDQKTSSGIFYRNSLKGLLLFLKGDNYYVPVEMIADSDEDALKLAMFSSLAVSDNMTMNEYIAAYSMTKKGNGALQKIFEGENCYEAYALSADMTILMQELGEE